MSDTVSKSQETILLDGDILALTPTGQAELQNSGTSLTPGELELLVLIDGRSTVGETSKRVRTLGKEDVPATCLKLLRMRFIQPASDAPALLDFVDFFQPKETLLPSLGAMANAKKELEATTRFLQQKGYSVRIARKAASGRQVDDAHTPKAIVVEDEPYLGDVLKHVLAGEGFDARIARNRAEIVAEFRQPPIPDLILLDVVLPDADGFDILHRIRAHHALKAVPVIMLTSEATRDAVLKGLAGGADGYITKPFEIDVLLSAVTAVLGLPTSQPAATQRKDPWQDR